MAKHVLAVGHILPRGRDIVDIEVSTALPTAEASATIYSRLTAGGGWHVTPQARNAVLAHAFNVKETPHA